jgi:hypothetical protein
MEWPFQVAGPKACITFQQWKTFRDLQQLVIKRSQYRLERPTAKRVRGQLSLLQFRNG